MAGIKIALRQIGFESADIEDHLNLDLDSFRNAVENFRGQIKEEDTVLFYYSGHGFEIGSANYLIPTDFKYRSSSKEDADNSISLSYLIDRLSNGRNLIVILDACRIAAPLQMSMEDPSRKTLKGLADLMFPGDLIAYSTSGGKASTAEGPDNMSLYTYELKQALLASPSTFQEALTRAKADTIAASKNQQFPATYDALGGTIDLRPGPSQPVPTQKNANDQIQVVIQNAGKRFIHIPGNSMFPDISDIEMTIPSLNVDYTMSLGDADWESQSFTAPRGALPVTFNFDFSMKDSFGPDIKTSCMVILNIQHAGYFQPEFRFTNEAPFRLTSCKLQEVKVKN